MFVLLFVGAAPRAFENIWNEWSLEYINKCVAFKIATMFQQFWKERFLACRINVEFKKRITNFRANHLKTFFLFKIRLISVLNWNCFWLKLTSCLFGLPLTNREFSEAVKWKLFICLWLLKLPSKQSNWKMLFWQVRQWFRDQSEFVMEIENMSLNIKRYFNEKLIWSAGCNCCKLLNKSKYFIVIRLTLETSMTDLGYSIRNFFSVYSSSTSL